MAKRTNKKTSADANGRKKVAPNRPSPHADALRALPSVSSLMEHPEVIEWAAVLPRPSVLAAVQTAIDEARSAIRSGELAECPTIDELLAWAEEELVRRSMPSLRRVVNATGIVLHTGLGRAPLCESAIDAIVEGAHGYCNVELDLESGDRGRREAHVTQLLSDITGAEAAIVVNNNAAATLMILKTFSEGSETIVSRGELVEIGGSYRLPEIMSASGAILREVGTTNRTRIGDYERALGENTALLMRVHTSNYRVVGFTESVAIDELAALAHEHELVCVDDLGSGALINFAKHGLPAEPSVRASIDGAADLVCFSGDKLVGGPQCGVIVGRADLVERIRKHPLMRTYRVGKLTLLALEATLREYIDPEEAVRQIPALAMLSASTDELADRARNLERMLIEALPDEHFYVCSGTSFAGGGSMPGRELDTVLVQWRPEFSSADDAVAALREAEIPVIARIHDDAITFDLRTLSEDDLEPLVSAVVSTRLDDEDEEAPRDGIPLPVV